jgi:NitT/TauT family transport system substrate-binding protein
MTFLRGRRAIAVAGACACLLAVAGCGSSNKSSSGGSSGGSSSGGKTASINLVLAWYPTPEYGGLYAAQSQGFFKKQGINVHIMPGGPQVSATQVVGSGQADIGYLNNDETLMEANENGIHLTEFATTYQKYPEAIEYHMSNPISTLSQINGKTLSGVTGSVDYQWLQHKYHVHNTVTPFSYATFSHNAKSLLLGYAPDDVPTLAAQGVKIGYVPIDQSGLQPYADILFAKSSYVSQNQALIKKFLLALGQGWQYFQSHYTTVDKVIFAADKTTPLAVDNEIAKVEIPFIYGGAATTSGIGAINMGRVQSTYSKLRALGVLKSNLTLSSIANASLVPKLLPSS